jgi:hypothetical protein
MYLEHKPYRYLCKNGDDEYIDDKADEEGNGRLNKEVHVRLPHLMLLTPAHGD